ncbi:MAG: alcohol dehydrogenase catalytic domain-containing protein [Acidimicrobiia bacterium]|nr:alcohol dehydrogenase catalytic domain-containing protein [Acidimicrobiia bacterium]MYG70893.1 alcohol dehydrogenase catalytic domain-containing protein [Acidimicrobiia bacterium]
MAGGPRMSRAVMLADYGRGPAIESLDLGPVLPGGALVRIDAATVCGTDVHISDGVFGNLARLPLVMGHEGTGTVVELGPGLERDALGQPIRTGDRVVWAHNWCGRCYFCAVAKQPTLCENTMGYGWGPHEEGVVNGTFSEHLHVSPDSRVLRVPESVSSPLASAATCALRTVMHALDRMPRIRFSDTVVVLGAGPVGVLAAAAAMRSGADQVVLIGAPGSRLAATESWELTASINIDDTEPDERIEAVRNMTEGRGADIVLECAGPPDAFTEGMEMVRAGGTLMVIGQAHGETVPVATTAMKVRQLTVRTSLSADISHFHDALRFLDRHGGELGLESVVCSKVYSLDQVTDALVAMRSGAEMKPVIIP